MLICEICPQAGETSFCLQNGDPVQDSKYWNDIEACTFSGDAKDACEFVLDQIGVEFRIVAKNQSGEYENRLATDAEISATCREIYFESETDFSDMRWAKIYLVWNAANQETDK